jgi:hypothetical protein
MTTLTQIMTTAKAWSHVVITCKNWLKLNNNNGGGWWIGHDQKEREFIQHIKPITKKENWLVGGSIRHQEK